MPNKEVKKMAQTKKAQENSANKMEESNQQTQPSTSRRTGANQPPGTPMKNDQSTQSNEGQSQGMTRGNQNRGLSRSGQLSSPFSFMRRFSEEMDRLFDDFGFGGGLMMPRLGHAFEQSMWSPQTEIFERGNNLVIRADLPGMTKDDIDVNLENDQIIIRGERHDERTEDDQGFYHTERSYGSFYRSIPLPQGIDGEQATADFRNGVLEITMPKPEQKSGGRRLEINEGGGQSSK
jgi:HSP20 family protein